MGDAGLRFLNPKPHFVNPRLDMLDTTWILVNSHASGKRDFDGMEEAPRRTLQSEHSRPVDSILAWALKGSRVWGFRVKGFRI